MPDDTAKVVDQYLTDPIAAYHQTVLKEKIKFEQEDCANPECANPDCLVRIYFFIYSFSISFLSILDCLL